MKFEKGALICGLLFVILLGVVSANSCGVKPIGDCKGATNGWYIVFEMSSDGNAHVQLPTATNDYLYAFCCDFPGSTDCSAPGSTKIIRMYSSTNAHAEIPDDQSPTYNPVYTVNACYVGLSCNSVVDANEECKSGNEVLSLSSITNAHAAKKGYYTGAGTRKICCSTEAAPDPVCNLEIATWTKDGAVITSATEGETIKLSLTGSSTCVGKNINFKITKVDGTLIEDMNGIAFSQGATEVSWKVKFMESGKDTTSDYVFRASLADDANKYKDSGKLTVKKGTCGDGIIQGRESCDPPNIGNCDRVCQPKSSFVPTTCQSINTENYDNEDIQDIIDLCNEFNPQQTRDINNNPSVECLINLKCSWTNDKCNPIDGDYADGYSADDENCKEIPKPNCVWIPNTDEACNANVDVITRSYTKDPSSTNCDETDFTQTVPCPETSMLPFFGFYQVIISLTIISIIYILMIVKKKKN